MCKSAANKDVADKQKGTSTIANAKGQTKRKRTVLQTQPATNKCRRNVCKHGSQTESLQAKQSQTSLLQTYVAHTRHIAKKKAASEQLANTNLAEK